VVPTAQRLKDILLAIFNAIFLKNGWWLTFLGHPVDCIKIIIFMQSTGSCNNLYCMTPSRTKLWREAPMANTDKHAFATLIQFSRLLLSMHQDLMT